MNRQKSMSAHEPGPDLLSTSRYCSTKLAQVHGPTQQTPDPEEVAVRKRPPSLGEVLLREAEELRANKAEEEARQKAEAEEAVQSPEQTKAFLLPNVHAVADSGHQIATRSRQVLPCCFRTSRKSLPKGRPQRSTCSSPESWPPESRTCPNHR